MHRHLFPLLLIFLTACGPRLRNYDFPQPVDTSTRPIALQEKRSWNFPGLSVDNQFDGARLNGLERVNDTLLVARIEPENAPINPSPWYAFRLVAERPMALTVRLIYPPEIRHRYYPKISSNRINWTAVDSSQVFPAADGRSVQLRLELPALRPLYLAGQEIVSSADVETWTAGLARRHPAVTGRFVAGESKLGRPLPGLVVAPGGELDKRKPIVAVMTRQHPPEITGYLAFQAFIDGLLDHPDRDALLERYQLLIYPLLNPDGVDLGHWRHTAGGIDSNRDWAEYRQPEILAIATDLSTRARANKAPVVLGIDFHSTYRDVYYTHNEAVEPPTALPGFKDDWLRAIERGLGGGFRVNEEAEAIGRPTSMSWFRTQFGAEGITYEIGDDTDRTFVRRKGLVSADALITTLLNRRP